MRRVWMEWWSRIWAQEIDLRDYTSHNGPTVFLRRIVANYHDEKHKDDDEDIEEEEGGEDDDEDEEEEGGVLGAAGLTAIWGKKPTLSRRKILPQPAAQLQDPLNCELQNGTAHCTLHTAHCTQNTAHRTLHTAHSSAVDWRREEGFLCNKGLAAKSCWWWPLCGKSTIHRGTGHFVFAFHVVLPLKCAGLPGVLLFMCCLQYLWCFRCLQRFFCFLSVWFFGRMHSASQLAIATGTTHEKSSRTQFPLFFHFDSIWLNLFFSYMFLCGEVWYGAPHELLCGSVWERWSAIKRLQKVVPAMGQSPSHSGKAWPWMDLYGDHTTASSLYNTQCYVAHSPYVYIRHNLWHAQSIHDTKIIHYSYYIIWIEYF